jgi:hypothetical protein
MSIAVMRRLCAVLLAAGWGATYDARAASTPADVLELAPPTLVVERRSAAAEDIFHLRRCVVHVGAGPVLLASARGGVMRTDDAVRIDVERPDGTHVTWEHDFRDGATGGIAEIPQQRLDALFTIGVHTVTIALLDLRPPVRSSTGYVLRYAALRGSPTAACLDGEAIALRKPTAAPSTAHAPDDALRWDGPPAAAVPRTAQPNQGVRPTVEQSPVRDYIAAATGVEKNTNVHVVQSVAAPTIHHRSHRSHRIDVGLGIDRSNVWDFTLASLLPAKTWTSFPYVLAAAVIGLLGLLAYAMRRTAPCMSGLLSVQDMQTGERLDHIELVQYGQRAWIQRTPLRLQAGVVAQDAAGGLAADGDGGCVFRSEIGGRRVLRDGDVVMIGEHVRLQYRAPATVYAHTNEAAS